MCELVTIASVAGMALSAGAAYQQGQVAKQVGRNNQIMAEYAAQDAVRKGEEDAIAVQRRASAIKGAQRAKLAASGVDLEIGTAGELQDQVDFFSQGDQNMARTNAARDAWSMRARGSQAAAEGDAGARTGNLQAFGTALSTGSSVAGKWYSMNGGWAPSGGGGKSFGPQLDPFFSGTGRSGD